MAFPDNGAAAKKAALIFSLKLPSLRKLFALIVAYSALAGFATHAFFSPLADALVFGSAAGIILFAFPALSAALIAASIASRKEFREQLKYFLFTAIIGSVVVSAAYASALLFTKSAASREAIMLLANALLLAIWYVALTVPLGKSKAKAFSAAIVHPLLSLAFTVIWGKLALSQNAVAIPFWLSLPKLTVAAAILLAALWLVFYLLNAPAKKKFGVSAVQAATLFCAHWLRGSKGIEEALQELGSETTTTIGGIAFKDNHNKIKTVFLAPNVHFGPFGNLGGSEFPFLLTQELRKACGIPIVFHGTVYHDYNPVDSSSWRELAKEFSSCIKSCKSFSSNAAFSTARKNGAQASCLQVGKNAFISLSPAPYPNGDIDFYCGTALANAAEKNFGTAVVVDRHSASGNIEMWELGSKEYYAFEDAVKSLSPKKQEKLSVGVACNALQEFSVKNGVGKAGLRVAVVKTGSKKACIAVFDANNTLPEFREKCLRFFGKKYYFADVFTTDTHAVNAPGLPHNSLGENASHEKLLEELKKTVDEAERNVSPCSACIFKKRFSLKVIGANKANELVTTMKAIVAVARIAVPIILIASVLLALAALVLL